MKHFVERTCTVVRERHEDHGRPSESSPSHETESRPMESFRQEPAYVLLGSPGSGKTKAFEREAHGDGRCYITARDFLTFGPDAEWEGRTIYIDGLDETRAGASDGRTPFDRIRAKLQSAGRPQFRLSCREADWFGANDRVRLQAVAPNGELLVLRLDPLSDQGVLESLEQNHGVDDPAAFVAEARKLGVADLLPNPQNLRMLAEAVAGAGEWPTTRTETFDMACGKLVSEENREHQIAWRGTTNTTALLDAAGDLCATLLLAGKAGVTLAGTEPDTDHPRLDHMPHGDQQLLGRVVGTNLFGSPAEGRLVPVHRQVAEFVAARRLADLIAEKLPVRRVLSLMTGFDGGIVSEFRGLAAWLAAHSKSARDEIIERDALGVVLYGDVEDFSAREKALVFKTLREETERNPWLVGYITLDSPLGRLADPGLEQEFGRALADPAREEAHQSFVFLVLDAIRSGPAVPGLADPLMAIVRDDSWPMMHRCAALEAYARVRQSDPRVGATLRSLLEDVYTGVVPTHNDDLLGALLNELYPDELSAADLVGYLREPTRHSGWTRYHVFWMIGVIENSTIEQIGHLLARLREATERVRGKSTRSPIDVGFMVRPSIVLLRHLLERSPESVPQEQLIYWLDFAGWLGERRIGGPGAVSDAEFFGKWLSDHPDIQKEIIERGIGNRPEDGRLFAHMYYVQRRLFGARQPEDYDGWCADQALAAGNDEIADWFVREAAEFVHNSKERAQEARERIVAKLSADARLSERFEGRLRALEDHDGFTDGPHAPTAPPTPPDGRFDELRATVREHLASLRANRCPVGLLRHLAVAYLDGFSDVRGETPRERLRYLLGPDDDLLGAALAGLRRAIRRADLPTWTEVAKLAAEDRTHPLAYPFMVGLEELARTAGTEDIHLTEAQTRLALSIHLAVPRLSHVYGTEGPPRWLRTAAASQPDVVAEVWSHCARHQLRKGAELLPDVYYLARQAENAPLASAVSIPLLRVFPIRCRSGQLTILNSLLQAAVLHGDTTQLLELIEAKLALTSMNASQRVYWLAAGLFARPEAYGDRLESFVSGRGQRIHRLMEMTVEQHAVPEALRDMWEATTLERLIRLIGPYSAPPPDTGEVYSVTLSMQADRSIHTFIDRLSKDSSDAAGNALESLAADGRLANWRSKLLDRLHQQKSVRREATFVHPRLGDIAGVLNSGRPANVADLWALATDILAQLARDIRDSATPDWREYWNVDKYNRAQTPRPENACRDALLSDLEQALTPLGIEAVREGSYADDGRSDIRLSVPGPAGYNVPIEIKRSCHDDWWSAIKKQLIAQYTRDPGADGYGVYLVFWFGDTENCMPTPASGRKPKSPEELRQSLLDSLSDLERRKISVCVIDVSNPKARR